MELLTCCKSATVLESKTYGSLKTFMLAVGQEFENWTISPKSSFNANINCWVFFSCVISQTVQIKSRSLVVMTNRDNDLIGLPVCDMILTPLKVTLPFFIVLVSNNSS